MIFNNNTIYAKVWKATPSEKYIDLQISTSEKKQDDDGYENSSWFPRAIGHAFNTLKNVKREDRITITKSKFTNVRYQTEDGEWHSSFRFLILEATIDGTDDAGDVTPTKTEAKGKTPAKKNEDAEQSSCPW